MFGGISEEFVHAINTENALVALDLNNNANLQSALSILESEVAPAEDPVLSSSEYRLHLVKALFYKVTKVFDDLLFFLPREIPILVYFIYFGQSSTKQASECSNSNPERHIHGQPAVFIKPR